MPSDLVESAFLNEAKGSHIGYKLGWGPVILGHNTPAEEGT
ncbi:MAG TPA: hypothetical protein VFS97_08180 [Nitrososphaeraceae archaeon]|nr:hypothetical protein [Nitrososphaeraceae archaeon]